MFTEHNSKKWQRPVLNVDGQSKFWDAQAPSYEKEDMTVDNQGEIDIVLSRFAQMSNLTDIVTLGGAVGCRDPKFLLEFASCGRADLMPRQIYFNDLSVEQVERARTSVLKPFQGEGIEFSYIPGNIVSCTESIPLIERRLFLGVYSAESFFVANPQNGYPMSGFDEYCKNARILGEHFLFEVTRVSGDGTEAIVASRELHVNEGEIERAQVKEFLRQMCSCDDVSSIRIIGQKEGVPGFFLSHWYTESGLQEMLSRVFEQRDFDINISRCAKGYVCDISRRAAAVPSGIVTILNNVLGNIIPDQQVSALNAIRRIM